MTTEDALQLCAYLVGEFIALLQGQPVHLWNACKIFTAGTDTGSHCASTQWFKIAGALQREKLIVSSDCLSCHLFKQLVTAFAGIKLSLIMG